MKKTDLIKRAEESFQDIYEFNEYAQHSEDLLIKVLPYLSIEGLRFIIKENKDIKSQMDGE